MLSRSHVKRRRLPVANAAERLDRSAPLDDEDLPEQLREVIEVLVEAARARALVPAA